jgi:hypothetical protein
MLGSGELVLREKTIALYQDLRRSEALAVEERRVCILFFSKTFSCIYIPLSSLNMTISQQMSLF